ncbi:MAG: HNH endonuclease [Candidatus Woesearchaeota archaeon]
MKKKITKKEQRKLERKERNKKDKEWKEKVKKRDGWCCIVCGEMKRLSAHHIIPREIKKTRHILDNGVALCPRHHKYSFIISAHRNAFAFYNFLWENRPEQLKRLLRV